MLQDFRRRPLADDPPVNASLPAAALGNTLRSYIPDATGAWLYQQFAMFGDPAAVAAAYGIPGNGAGLGMASGGLPPEGALYGYSYSFLLGELLALQTAGFNNPAYSGPQIQLIGAPVWDRFVTGYLTQTTPAAKVFPAESYLGPVYQFGGYGEFHRLYVTPGDLRPFALLALLEQQNGQNTHVNAIRWFARNALQGGPATFYTRMTDPYSFSETVLYFLLFDPTAAAPTDPRPTCPTVFVDSPAGRMIAHGDWSPNGAMFDYKAGWNTIDHQNADAGQFEFYRNGEWLTKEMSGYDGAMETLRSSMFHNTLSLEHTCPAGTPTLRSWEGHSWSTNSQILNSLSAGDPTTATSSGAGYAYAATDMTGAYNRPNVWSAAVSSTNTSLATRSIVWLNNDYIVVYDRATSVSSGTFKRFTLSLIANPSITGNTATETLASGQRLFVQTLLPANATLTADSPTAQFPYLAELEPTQYILTVEDTTKPSDVRFLHVLQGANAGAPMAQATRVQSAGGASFDGAIFANAAVYFPVYANTVFVSTTLPLPAGVTTMLVAGLAPNTSYSASVQSGNAVTITAGTGTTTDAAGVLRLTF